MPGRRVSVGGAALELVQGDITLQDVDAIVNAANAGLRGGGGVDGAIHRAGGPAILAACRAIGSCRTGEAVITIGGNLKASRVIHTVGPIWKGGQEGEPGLLASCYRRSLALAAENGLSRIAFPSVSTGVYGYPVDLAARVAIRAVLDGMQSFDIVSLVRFVLFDSHTYDAYSKALDEARIDT